MERKEHSSCEKGGKLSATLVENKMKGPRVVTHRARGAGLEDDLGAVVTHWTPHSMFLKNIHLGYG